MADIIPFKPKPQAAASTPTPGEVSGLIWTCTHCGCMTFRLRSEGDVECAACFVRTYDSDHPWRSLMPDPPAAPPLVDPAVNRNVVLFGEPSDARAHVIEKATSPDADPIVLAVIQRDGSIISWTDGLPADAETYNWLHDRLQALTKLALNGRDAK